MPSLSEIIVIGRGLAGSVLYEVLRERGIPVRVFDRPRIGSASRVAAGVVNPIVLRRIVPSWRALEFLPIAEHFYRSLEDRYNIRLWHPLPLVKCFTAARDREEWRRRSDDPQVASFLSLDPAEGIDASSLIMPHGYGVVTGCAWVDVPAWLDAQRVRLLSEGALIEVDGPVNEQRPTDNGPTISCTGPFASIAGLVPVKGELLTVRIPGLRLNAMAHRNAFLLPLGDETYRLGSTFAWEDVWSGPSVQARDELLRRLRKMIDADVEVIDHRAGVRPTARDRRPILGPLPRGNNEFVFNGLGSRGVLLAPWCARHLADHLADGKPLDPEVDVSRFGA